MMPVFLFMFFVFLIMFMLVKASITTIVEESLLLKRERRREEKRRLFLFQEENDDYNNNDCNDENDDDNNDDDNNNDDDGNKIKNNKDESTTRRKPKVNDIFSCNDVLSSKLILLPEDIILRICHYLHPKSITTIVCCNSACRNTIALSNELWKFLWFRDFGHVLLQNETLRQNIYDITFRQRKQIEEEDTTTISSFYSTISKKETISNDDNKQQQMNKTNNETIDDDEDDIYRSINDVFASIPSSFNFYFEFQECYLDYCLAGLNTPFTEIYMGLHGHIIRFTDFAPNHPGRAEPVMAYCGGDVTDVYEDFHLHSESARRHVARLAVVLHSSCCYKDTEDYRYGHRRGGKRKKNSAKKDYENLCGLMLPQNTKEPAANVAMPMNIYSKNRRPPSLSMIRTEYMRQKLVMTAYVIRYGSKLRKQQIQRKTQIHPNCPTNSSYDYDPPSQDADVRLFYDPFRQKWCGWYNDTDWTPVRIDLPDILVKN